MDCIIDKIVNLVRVFNKDVDFNCEYIDYKMLCKQYEVKVNEEVL